MSNPLQSITDLQASCYLFSDLPERYFVELEKEGAIRTYRLDEGAGSDDSSQAG